VRRKTYRFLLSLVLLMCAAEPLMPQSRRAHIPQEPQQQQPDEQELKQQRDLAKKFNKERHEALKRDTDKLLQLATELKQYVDKSNENLLSVDVIRKSEEIEKLAHSVKDKMKGY
jgi:hypothetical protein